MRFSFITAATLLGVFVACNGPGTSSTIPFTDSSSTAKAARPRTYSQLLEMFKPVQLDTLEINSPNDDSSSRFWGSPIDSSYMALLPEEIRSHNGLGAICRFEMDSINTGLLVRKAGEYSYTSVALLAYNKTVNKITGWTEVANTWGDAGDAETKHSWLFTTPQKSTRMLLWVNEYHDHSVNDESDTTKESIDHYYLLNVSSRIDDTIENNNASLLKQFGHLLNPKN